MLVGLGEAGKTSLLNALRRNTRNLENKENEEAMPVEITDGIDIKVFCFFFLEILFF